MNSTHTNPATALACTNAVFSADLDAYSVAADSLEQDGDIAAANTLRRTDQNVAWALASLARQPRLPEGAHFTREGWAAPSRPHFDCWGGYLSESNAS